MMVKLWVLEKLEQERHLNKRENDLLKKEVRQSIHQAHFSRRSAVEHGWSVLNERGVSDLQGQASDLQGRARDLEREMERMTKRVSSMEQQMAKMQQECVKEKEEMARRESERIMEMEKEIERVRKEMEKEIERVRKEMEKEMITERREMAKREKEKESQVKRCILHLQKERTREKKEMESEMESLRAETKRMECRQNAMEKVVEGIEALVIKRGTALLQKVEAIDKLQDRVDQMEVLASSQQDSQYNMELGALVNAKLAGLERHLNNKMSEMADYLEKAVTKTTNHCLLMRARTLIRHDDDDQSETTMEDQMVAGHSAYNGSMRGDKAGRKSGRQRRARVEDTLSSTKSGSESGNVSGSGTGSGNEDGNGNGSRSRGSGSRRKRECERKSLRRRAVEVDSETSSAMCSESHRPASGVETSKTGSDLSVKAGNGANNKRGFFRKLFGKKKGNKS